MVRDLLKSGLPFSLHFDETTSTQKKKQMDLTLRYWSTTHNEVWVTYYTSLFFGHAEAEKVLVKMYEQLLSDGIPVDKMATLIQDGPNVNKAIFRKMNELITQDHPDFMGLIDLGSCSIHIIHNAFGKGLEQYGKGIDQLCIDLYSLFKYSAARWEDLRKFQQDMEAEVSNFQQHTEVRWLSIGSAIKRILEQWNVITKFIEELAKDSKNMPKSVNFKRVHAMLATKEKAVTRVSLEFLNDVFPVFEEFLFLFQKECPIVHILYDSLCHILLRLLRRFMVRSAIDKKYGCDLASIECKDIELQLSDKDIVIGVDTRKALKDLSHDQQKYAMLGIWSFFSITVAELQSKLPLKNDLLRQLGCLNPLKKNNKSTQSSIEKLSSLLQPKLNISEIVDEWKLFQVDNDIPAYNREE